MFDLGGKDRLNDGVAASVAALDRCRADLFAEMAQSLEARAWRADGAPTPISWLRYRTGITSTEARRTVAAAELMRRYPQIATGVTDGSISPSHVDTLAIVARPERLDLLDKFIDELLSHTGLRVDRFAVLCHRWADLADDALDTDPTAERDYFLRVAPTLFGEGDVSGHLDAQGTAVLIAALDAHDTGPDPVDGPAAARSLAERRADALVDMAAGSMGSEGDGSPTEGRSRFAATLVLDWATATGTDPALDRIRQDLLEVGPVPRRVTERLLCDASVRVLTLGPDGQPLDLGRTTPVVSPAQRRALVVRDQHCQFPGCDRPTQWCDAHHLDHWLRDDGPTDLGNLVLLCRRHHRLVHHGWELERNIAGLVTASRPDGTRFRQVGPAVQRFEPGHSPAVV